jgi:FixJ family two-component response regulator
MICSQSLLQSSTDGSARGAHLWAMQEPVDKGKAVKRPVVSIVDDDESVRESLPDLVRVLGFTARAFSSAEEFLSSNCADETSCLILDVMMPGMSGPELQRELKLRRRKIPIVFITAQTKETIRAEMLEQGAVECLIKPFSDTDLLDALNLALRAKLKYC